MERREQLRFRIGDSEAPARGGDRRVKDPLHPLLPVEDSPPRPAGFACEHGVTDHAEFFGGVPGGEEFPLEQIRVAENRRIDDERRLLSKFFRFKRMRFVLRKRDEAAEPREQKLLPVSVNVRSRREGAESFEREIEADDPDELSGCVPDRLGACAHLGPGERVEIGFGPDCVIEELRNREPVEFEVAVFVPSDLVDRDFAVFVHITVEHEVFPVRVAAKGNVGDADSAE